MCNCLLYQLVIYIGRRVISDRTCSFSTQLPWPKQSSRDCQAVRSTGNTPWLRVSLREYRICRIVPERRNHIRRTAVIGHSWYGHKKVAHDVPAQRITLLLLFLRLPVTDLVSHLMSGSHITSRVNNKPHYYPFLIISWDRIIYKLFL